MDSHEEDNDIIRSSRSQMFFRIGVLKNFAIFTGKHLCRSLFLIKLQCWRPATLLKRDSTQVFSCEYCKIFKNTFFYRTPLVATFFLSYCFSCTPAIIWFDFFWKKYYLDLFTDVIFYFHNFYSYFLAIARL